MKNAVPKCIVFAMVMCLSHAVWAAEYESVAPFPISCEGVLVLDNGWLRLAGDRHHLNSESDIDRVCLQATIATKNNNQYSFKYELGDREIGRVLKTCAIGRVCRIEGQMGGLTHDTYFFVKIDSISAR